MPAPAKPRPKPSVPPNLVQVAGHQSQFQEAGFALAAKLGWAGEPTDETNDINVEDAQNFIIKTLHEAFQAGAFSKESFDHLPACEHLGVIDDKELALFATECTAMFESGKGAAVQLAPKVIASTGANLILPISKAAEAAGKAG